MIHIEQLSSPEKPLVQEVVYTRLDELLARAEVLFDNEDRLIHRGKGYERYYRDNLLDGPMDEPKVYEEDVVYRDRRGAVRFSAHRFQVQIFSGAAPDRSSADLVTTFGIDQGTGSLVVGQLEGPGQESINPGICLYDIYGVQARPVDEQWQVLRDALGA